MFDKFGCKVIETIRNYTKKSNFANEKDLTTKEIDEALMFLDIKLTDE